MVVYVYIEVTTLVTTKAVKTHPASMVENPILKRKEMFYFLLFLSEQVPRIKIPSCIC